MTKTDPLHSKPQKPWREQFCAKMFPHCPPTVGATPTHAPPAGPCHGADRHVGTRAPPFLAVPQPIYALPYAQGVPEAQPSRGVPVLLVPVMPYAGPTTLRTMPLQRVPRAAPPPPDPEAERRRREKRIASRDRAHRYAATVRACREAEVALLHSTVERLPNLDGEREAIMRRPHGTVMPIIDTEPMRGLAIVLSDGFREAWLASGNPAGGYFTVQSVAFASCGIHDAAQNAVVASYQQPDRTTGPQSRFRIALSKETEAWITLLRGARAQAIRLYYATFVACTWPLNWRYNNSPNTWAATCFSRPLSTVRARVLSNSSTRCWSKRARVKMASTSPNC